MIRKAYIRNKAKTESYKREKIESKKWSSLDNSIIIGNVINGESQNIVFYISENRYAFEANVTYKEN